MKVPPPKVLSTRSTFQAEPFPRNVSGLTGSHPKPQSTVHSSHRRSSWHKRRASSSDLETSSSDKFTEIDSIWRSASASIVDKTSSSSSENSVECATSNDHVDATKALSNANTKTAASGVFDFVDDQTATTPPREVPLRLRVNNQNSLVPNVLHHDAPMPPKSSSKTDHFVSSVQVQSKRNSTKSTETMQMVADTPSTTEFNGVFPRDVEAISDSSQDIGLSRSAQVMTPVPLTHPNVSAHLNNVNQQATSKLSSALAQDRIFPLGKGVRFSEHPDVKCITPRGLQLSTKDFRAKMSTSLRNLAPRGSIVGKMFQKAPVSTSLLDLKVTDSSVSAKADSTSTISDLPISKKPQSHNVSQHIPKSTTPNNNSGHCEIEAAQPQLSSGISCSFDDVVIIYCL
jgi:hypothetical protein